MSKINNLTKKIEVFERLAVFSDRNSFLKSLSQDYTAISNNSELKGSIETLITSLLGWSNSNGMPKNVIDYSKTLESLKDGDLSKEHLDQLVSIVSSIAQMNLGANWNTEVLPSLSHLYSELSNKKNELSQVNVPAKDIKYDEYPITIVNDTKYPSIPVDVQKKLSDLMVELNIGLPLHKIDGILGPETTQALNNYKKAFGLEKATLPEVFEHIKTYKSIDDSAKENKEYIANK